MKDMNTNDQEQIKQRLSDSLRWICDQFMQEKIHSAKLNLMPPRDKVPEIYSLDYENIKDVFTISIKEKANNYINGNGIDFSKNDNGHFAAARIKKFSLLDNKSLMGNLISTIEKEKKLLSENIETKPDIVDYVVDKRILIFLELLIKKYYADLKRLYIKKSPYSPSTQP